MSSEKLGFALRPGIFAPSEIRDASRTLEANDRVAGIFIPDGRSGYEAIEIASSILSSTGRIYAGSGVIRLPEHDPAFLARRIQTIQAFSGNRLILGVGTGSPGSQPGKTVMAMLDRVDELNRLFQAFPSGIEAPEIFVAALKAGIAKRAVGKADGLLLNFCSPQHASSIVETVKTQMAAEIEFACYLKIFFSSKNDEEAQRLMIQEFLNYDSTIQYHEMFMQDGTAEAISHFRIGDSWKKGRVTLPKEMLRVSLANAGDEEVHDYVETFRKAKVTLPVIYPYFPADEKPEFKQKTVRRLTEAA